MNKTILSVFLIFLWFLNLNAQNKKYQVMAVTGGTATLVKKTQTVKTGMQLSENQKLRFSSDQVKILIYSKSQGRKIIRPQNYRQNNDKLEYLIAENIFEASKSSSTRSGEGINQLADLKKHFCEADRYIFLGGEIQIKMKFLKDPEDPNGGFYLRYTHEGNVKNIPLPYQDDYVVISQKNIYRDIIPFHKALLVELCHYQAKNQESRCFCTFSLVPVNNDILKDELQSLLNHLSCDQKIEEVANYIIDRYEGQPVKHNVKKWVETYLCQ